MKWIVAAISFFAAVASFYSYTELTFFVVQRIGAVPEGATFLIHRRRNGVFIDSADAFCERTQGKVTLLCRGIVLGSIAGRDGEGVLFRMPYSRKLYLISTDGQEYSR